MLFHPVRRGMAARHPQWVVPPEQVLQVPFPFRVVDLPDGALGSWKEKAKSEFGLISFTIRPMRRSPSAFPSLLTLLGPRPVALACFQQFIKDLNVGQGAMTMTPSAAGCFVVDGVKLSIHRSGTR